MRARVLLAISVLLILACGFILTGWAWPKVRSAVGPPGVILISIDTLRPDHLGAYGYFKPTSPNLDRFASQSVLFEKAYSASTWTLPSHTSLLTGLTVDAHGIVSPRHRLENRFQTLADLYRDAGYRTAAWIDYVFLDRGSGLELGFEFYDQKKLNAEKIVPESLAWLDEHSKEKFFLFLHFMDVHGPFKQPHPAVPRTPATESGRIIMPYLNSLLTGEYLESHKYGSLEELVDAYDGGIRRFDHWFGVLINELKRKDLFENTTILVLSDHGESFYEHETYVGHSVFLYDEFVRIPMMLKLPEGRYAGTRFPGPVSLLSAMPTLLAVSGIQAPSFCQGPSLLPYLDGRHSQYGMMAQATSPLMGGSMMLCSTDWKWIERIRNDKEIIITNFIKATSEASREQLRSRIPDGDQLFFLPLDPGEQRNALEEAPYKADWFRSKATSLRKESERIRRSFRPGNVQPSNHIDEDKLEQLRALGYVDD